MKKLNILFAFCLALCLSACEYDNYDGPECRFTGHVTYQGKPYVFDGNKSVLKAVQKGFGKNDGGTPIRINEDGTFAQLLFAGDYTLPSTTVSIPSGSSISILSVPVSAMIPSL